MRRSILLVAAIATCLGCRSGWNPLCGPGSRVPPPPTGSYGTPNSYYQPGIQSVPATISPSGARSAVVPSNRWSTVRDEPAAVAATDPSNKPIGSGVKFEQQSSTSIASTKPKMNGMRVNEVRSTAEPAPFTPDSSVSELNPGSVRSDRDAESGVKTASAESNNSGGNVTTASWQSRSSSSRSITRP